MNAPNKSTKSYQINDLKLHLKLLVKQEQAKQEIIKSKG
jgi:hypothetical protein